LRRAADEVRPNYLRLSPPPGLGGAAAGPSCRARRRSLRTNRSAPSVTCDRPLGGFATAPPPALVRARGAAPSGRGAVAPSRLEKPGTFLSPLSHACDTRPSSPPCLAVRSAAASVRREERLRWARQLRPPLIAALSGAPRGREVQRTPLPPPCRSGRIRSGATGHRGITLYNSSGGPASARGATAACRWLARLSGCRPRSATGKFRITAQLLYRFTT